MSLQVGWVYFKLHPKGRGVICNVPEGIPAFTFVEEYLGELHSPWRWFEVQVRMGVSQNTRLLANPQRCIGTAHTPHGSSQWCALGMAAVLCCTSL